MTPKYIYALHSKVFLDFLEKIPAEKIRKWEKKYEADRPTSETKTEAKTNEKASR